MLYIADEGWESNGLNRVFSKNISNIVKTVFNELSIITEEDNLSQVTTNVFLDDKRNYCLALLNSWNCEKKPGIEADKQAFYILEGKSKKVTR